MLPRSHALVSGLRTHCARVVREVLELYAPPLCPACDEPTAVHRALCALCLSGLERTSPTAVQGVLAPYAHDGTLVSLVHRAKFAASELAAQTMGLLLRDCLSEITAQFDVVVPVPLHDQRLRERGYNQSHVIAQMLDAGPVVHALARPKRTLAQARLTREDRADNVRDAFVLQNPRLVRGLRVLLVDDVVTTGATLTAAHTALLAAQPSSVHCVAVARAILRSGL
ncbi:MAG: phosphoribosyltransferase family protein [Deltaproteobacteria bacterium]|nr:phosphoribosyltransferase family protein [Deltaproteobacteria bacterium]